jgi:glycosyltransferase involved in cell wall biosynthesis
LTDSCLALPPRFSIVIPTYQRRDIVLESVRALASQTFNGWYEVIVVVDGSNDGSAEALRSMATPFPLTVIEQPNKGLANARNRGAAVAQGEIILFLDDDMEAHSRLLAEHDRSHQKGADVVMGHIPLHPKSPANFLSSGVKAWAEDRCEILSRQDAQLPLHDLLGGQLSLTQKTFLDVSGFDTDFNINGSFGNEDLDFGYRLRQKGFKIVFNPNAISWQRYVVTPRQHLKQYRQAGRSAVIFARKHPDQIENIFDHNYAASFMDRLIWYWFRWPIRKLFLALLDMGFQSNRVTNKFFWMRRLEYCQGIREAGGVPQPRPLRILCYHSISDLSGSSMLKAYGIPPRQFHRQLDLLKWAGFRFIDVKEFLRFLNGKAGLPRRAVLVTFDDCYKDLLDNALPILEELRIPAVAFAVSKCTDGTNDWDKAIGATQLELLDIEGLQTLARRGIVIGSHTRTHPMLNRLSSEEMVEEIQGSIADLEAAGLDCPSLFAYPHGEHDLKVHRVIEDAGFQAAFTIEPDIVLPGQDPYQVPRIEVLRDDVGWKFLWKVLMAGRSKFLFTRQKRQYHTSRQNATISVR